MLVLSSFVHILVIKLIENFVFTHMLDVFEAFSYDDLVVNIRDDEQRASLTILNIYNEL